SEHRACELAPVLGHERGLARREREERDQLLARFALAPILRALEDLEQFVHRLLVTALARVNAGEREPRRVIRGARLELRAELRFGRALIARARVGDALAHGLDARRNRGIGLDDG